MLNIFFDDFSKLATVVLWPLKAIGLHNYNFPLYRGIIAGFKLRSNNDGDVFHATFAILARTLSLHSNLHARILLIKMV